MDLQKRLMSFSIEVIKLCRLFPHSEEYFTIKKQLIKSATSIGANYQEAQSAISRPDFNNKVRISLKEASETKYWLELLLNINTSKKLNSEKIQLLLKESTEIQKILGKIAVKTDSKFKG
jgi:four helix bundle protein